MEDVVRLIVQYLHVTAGLLWVGGGFYTILVQSPALMATPPHARSPAIASIAPRQVFYLLRLGELTVVSGVLRILVSGRGRELEDLSSRWALAILVGGLLAVVLLVIGHAILKPAITRLLALGPKAAQGDGSAAAETGAIVRRLTTIGYVELALGLAIILGMVLARLS